MKKKLVGPVHRPPATAEVCLPVPASVPAHWLPVSSAVGVTTRELGGAQRRLHGPYGGARRGGRWGPGGVGDGGPVAVGTGTWG